MPDPLELVSTADQIADNVQSYNNSIREDPDRALLTARATTYWIHDRRTGLFAPNKWCGYREMTAARYQAAVDGDHDGDPFDGTSARKAIEKQIGTYKQRGELDQVLREWADGVFFPGALEGLAHDRRFALVRRRRSWIFQANPDHFDIDGFLQSNPERFSWTVRQHQEEVEQGDQVFLWRAAGKKREQSGIIAEAEVVSEIWEGLDEEGALKFWKRPEDRRSEQRVWIRIARVANKKEVIKREWLIDDPICRDLLILKQSAGTNYPLARDHLHRIERLWERTAVDWNREDCLAALWAYDVTYGQPISQKPGSPVSEVALRIGRAVGGVYNKVLNFRAIDPRDARAGLSGGGQTDRAVWAEFYDPDSEVLQSDRLEIEYLEIWGAGDLRPADQGAGTEDLPPAPQGGVAPGRTTTTISRIIRDTSKSNWVKKAHDYRCQICGLRIEGRAGPYAEGAHIQPLGAEHRGKDDVANILCLCPNHHVLLDLGAIAIGQGMEILGTGVSASLRTDAAHVIDSDCIRYHRQHIAGLDE